VAVVKCQNNHFYDDEKYSRCPHCMAIQASKASVESPSASTSQEQDRIQGKPAYQAVSLDIGTDSDVVVEKESGMTYPDDEKTLVSSKASEQGSTNNGSSVNNKPPMLSEDEKTIGYYQQKINIDPVVGWLVCMSGLERGRDYRLHVGQNFVGRSYGMDVVVSEDAKISRDRHCAFIYEPVKNSFYIVPGEGTVSYLNNDLLIEPKSLVDGDIITIGDTQLVFVSFCREGYTWA